jgi:hypothetical protein
LVEDDGGFVADAEGAFDDAVKARGSVTSLTMRDCGYAKIPNQDTARFRSPLDRPQFSRRFPTLKVQVQRARLGERTGPTM